MLIILLNLFQQPTGVSFVMIPIIQMSRLRPRELKLLRAGSKGTKIPNSNLYQNFPASVLWNRMALGVAQKDLRWPELVG